MKTIFQTIFNPIVLGGDGAVPPTEFLLFKRGWNSAEGYPNFLVDDLAMKNLIGYFKSGNVDIPIDYEHQTLTGQEAPAAGWIRDLVATPEGLVAKVKWTARGAEYLTAKEYRYFSPAVLIRASDKRAAKLQSVALTNVPRMREEIPLVAKDTGGDPHKTYQKENTMTLQEFIAKIGEVLTLKLEGDEEAQINAVLKAIPEKITPAEKEVIPEAVLTALKLSPEASASEVVGTIHALAQKDNVVSVEEFQKMKQDLAERKRDELVAMAMTQGKIAPAQKEWAEKYALDDPEGFEVYVAKAPVVVPVGKTHIDTKDTHDPTADETTLLVAKKMGVSPENLKKYGTA